MKAMIKINGITIVVINFLFFFGVMYVSRPKNTMEIVTCPLGKDRHVFSIKVFSGRALSKISFVAKISIPEIIIVIVNSFAFFFEIFL